MPGKNSPAFSLLVYIVSAVLITVSLIRDIDYERLYSDDLRNRVVGARLINDGRSPYYYKWQPGDGMRYYDGSNFHASRISNTTASPFLHQLLIPFCNFSQRTISLIWLYAGYVMILLIGFWSHRLAEGLGKPLSLLFISAFLFTDGWIRHILAGQYYLLIPFLFFVIFMLLRDRPAVWKIVFAAMIAVSIVLIRPIAVVAFIPFAFIFHYWRAFIASCIVTALAYAVFVLASPFQSQLYSDYFSFLSDAKQEHQGRPLPHYRTAADPGYTVIEGFDLEAIKKQENREQIHSRNEHGNIFVIWQNIFGSRMPEGVLYWSGLVAMLVVILAFYFIARPKEFAFPQCLLLGFIIYLVAEIFSPVHRHQYNSVQFLFPVLLSVISYVRLQPGTSTYIPAFSREAIYLVAAGLLLNVIRWDWLPMKNTIGEFIMIAGFFVAVVSWRVRNSNSVSSARSS